MPSSEEVPVRVARIEEQLEASKEAFAKLAETVAQINTRTIEISLQLAAQAGAGKARGSAGLWVLAIVNALAAVGLVAVDVMKR